MIILGEYTVRMRSAVLKLLNLQADRDRLNDNKTVFNDVE